MRPVPFAASVLILFMIMFTFAGWFWLGYRYGR